LIFAEGSLEGEPFLERQQDLADAEQADHRHQEVEAGEQRGSSRRLRRSAPVTGSVPTAARAKPSIIEAMVLERRLLAHADEGAEREQVDREELGVARTRARRLATTGEMKVIRITATSAPTNEEVNAAVSALPGAFPAAPADSRRKWLRPTTARREMLNRIEVMAPPKRAPQ